MDTKLAELIDQKSINAVMAPIDSAMSLPANAYTTQQWLELEIERIFARRWMGVCFECELSEPGDVRAFELFGMPLVAVRGDDRVLRVFGNRVERSFYSVQFVNQIVVDKQLSRRTDLNRILSTRPRRQKDETQSDPN